MRASVVAVSKTVKGRSINGGSGSWNVAQSQVVIPAKDFGYIYICYIYKIK